MKFNEDKILSEVKKYIGNTYGEHYSEGDVQTLDFIEACGDAPAFCRSNILKYASRRNTKKRLTKNNTLCSSTIAFL